MLDLDLSILGEEAETFARFEDEIRRDPRALRGASPHLRHALLRDRYEARARENLAWARRRLGRA